MVLRQLRYEVVAEDRSAEAAEEVEGRWSNLFGGLAGRAAAVGAALLTGISNAVDEAEARLQRLRISTGQGTAEQQAALIDLLARATPEEAAIDAIAAVSGSSRTLGIGLQDVSVLERLADVATVGTSPRDVLQSLQGFGVTGAGPVAGATEVAAVAALSVNVDPSVLFDGLREYGPVLSALGLNYLEAAALLLDLQQEGINISRVSPALNRFIRNASRGGLDARTAATQAFQGLIDAGEVEAAALGQELFGDEGGLRLTQAVRSGRVGLSPEQLSLAGVAALPNLAAITEGTNLQTFQGVIDATQQRGGFRGALGGIASGVEEVPVLGDVFGANLSRLFGAAERPDAGIVGASQFSIDALGRLEDSLIAAQLRQERILERQLELQERALRVQERAEELRSRGARSVRGVSAEYQRRIEEGDPS